MTASTVLYFLGASIALTLAPGPDNLFVMSQGMTRGRRPAFLIPSASANAQNGVKHIKIILPVCFTHLSIMTSASCSTVAAKMLKLLKKWQTVSWAAVWVA